MPVPPITVEEFAAKVRVDRGFGSDHERADTIRQSELIAAAAFDFARREPFMGAALPHSLKRGTHRAHRMSCARHCAATVGIPVAAVGMPPFLIAILFGLATKLVVELIWKASGMIADWLNGGRE